MLKYAKKVLETTKLSKVWYIEDNNLVFKYKFYLYSLQYQKIYLEMKGTFKEVPYRRPQIEWVNNKPAKYSYHAGGEYFNELGNWIDSTLVEKKVENLYIAYLLAEKYQVIYLISKTWDELFYTRSKYTYHGMWSPFPPQYADKQLENIQNEILFFSELKNYIYLDNQYLKNPINNNSITPLQRKFIYNNNVMIVMILMEYISINYNEFEESLFDLIFSYLPNEHILKKIWKLDIFRWKQTKRELVEHFLEFNNINFLGKSFDKKVKS